MLFHTKNIDETLLTLESHTSGLSNEEAEKRQKTYGLNVLPSKPDMTLLAHFLQQFKSPIIYILLLATFMALVIEEYTDSGFILAVLVLNAIIGTYQEYSASQKARLLQDLIKSNAMVLREGVIHEIESQYIVPGDILVFESGTKVAADVRLTETKNLTVDEALLTGESVDVNKDALFSSDNPKLLLPERRNMLFAGTYISTGRAMGVVSGTGKETEAGKIAQLLSKESKAKIPLLEKMEKLSFTISIVIGIIS